MLRMRDYTPRAARLARRGAASAGVPLRRGLRIRLATDALIALQGRLSDRVRWPRSTSTRWPRNYHSQRDMADDLDLGTVAATAAVCLRGASRCAQRAGQLPRAPDRVLARGDRAREAVLLELREQLAELRARAGCRARARARRRAPAARGGPAARSANASAEHLAGELDVARRSPRSALRPRVASRSATVNTVTSALTRLGGAQVAPDRARGRAAARGRGSRAAGGGGQSAAT